MQRFISKEESAEITKKAHRDVDEMVKAFNELVAKKDRTQEEEDSLTWLDDRISDLQT